MRTCTSNELVPLNAGESVDVVLGTHGSIPANAPILVAQYSNGTTYDGQQGDRSMMLLPWSPRFLDSYTFSTPSNGFNTHFVNIVALSADALSGAVLLDGVPVPAGSFTPMPGSPYYGTQVAIGVGAHTLQAPNPFGITVYGFGAYRCYGYTGGFSVIP